MLFLGAVSLHAGILTKTDTYTLSSTEGSVLSGTLATIFDNNLSDPASVLSGTIQWSDGTSSAAAIAGSDGTFSVDGTHTYAEAGLYTVGFTVQDNVGDILTSSGHADVADAALSTVAHPGSFAFTPGVALTNLLLLSFSDADLDSSAADFSALINWGDGTTSAAVIEGTGNGQYNVLGGHTYATLSDFTVNLSVDDFAGSTLSTQTSAIGGVPEPGTFGLTIAAAGFAAFRRRRRG